MNVLNEVVAWLIALYFLLTAFLVIVLIIASPWIAAAYLGERFGWW